ncbi:MAG TPA: glycosyltransferase family 1 protein [Chitinophagales bacterium]|nr:glycosyltransferase family 1 protein [Chitinophagales bacterium]HNM28389.1 glycosyltransferase family 1 protein [Chitinophagales bacterium]
MKNLASQFPENEYFLFTPNAKDQLSFNAEGNIKTVIGRGSVWRSFGIRRDILKHKIDVFHGLSNELPFSINKADVKSVVTIHDLIFDLFPHHYPGVDRTVYELKTKFAVNNADVVIAASESTRNDLVRMYGKDPAGISVVYQSCDDIFYAPPAADISSYRLPKQYMLYVGSVTERKNLLAVCNAYTKLPSADRLPCVIVGNGKRYADEVRAFVSANHLTSSFIFLENVPTDHLPALYANALCFIYPSLYEGFGIPILESMVSGCPVITSSVSSLPEVGGDAALYFNPENPEDIAAQIQRVVGDEQLRQNMINKGKLHAQQFEKSKVTRQLMSIYKQ